jgi:RNA polymerase-binding protein DksA
MKRGKTTATAVNRERHQVLKAMLEARRDEIQTKLRTLRETLPDEVAQVKDAEEQSVHDFVQEVELALMEMKSETLAKIDDAMIRLEAGTYGSCAECGEEIAEARLQAVPFARAVPRLPAARRGDPRGRDPQRAQLLHGSRPRRRADGGVASTERRK